MREASHIGKDQKNSAQGFKYRGIDDVYNGLHSIFAKHGVYMTPEVLDRRREERTNKSGTVLAFTILRMRYTFYAEDGSSVSCVVDGEGMDSGDKSSNKAMAVAHKYALLQTFLIPTAETKDPDAETHEVQAETREAIANRECSRLIDTVRTISDGISAYQASGALSDLSAAAEAWAELTDDEKRALWVAPTKMEAAGFEVVFTTAERQVMQTPEFRTAHREES